MSDHTRQRAVELCRRLEDTFDQWRDLGECFDELGREWVAGQETDGLRIRNGNVQGLRKRMVIYLWGTVEQTGIPRKYINRALQLFALEKHAPWVSQIRSESKARVLVGFVRWGWDGCKLVKDGKRGLAASHQAIADVGFERITVAQVRTIVWGIRGKKTHGKQARSTAQRAVGAMLDAIEGSETHKPAEREDLARWLDVLLEASPLVADLLGAAFVRLEQRRGRTVRAA